MPATKRFVNWTTVSVNSVPITGVTGVAINSGGNLLSFSGDGDVYDTTIINDHNEPGVQISAADLGAIRSLPPGTRGAFTATHNDAKNKAATGGGAVIYSSATAIVADNPVGGQHRQIGAGTLNLRFESADGQTNPLASAAA